MNGGDLKWKGTGIILTGITQRKSSSSGSSKTGAIVGVVVGIVGLLALIVPTIVICRRRKSRGSKAGGMGGARQDLPTLGASSVPKQQAEGLAASPGEKSALADGVTIGPQATTDILRSDVKRRADVPVAQDLQATPTLAPTWQPLPVPSPAQLSPSESTAAQLSAQQLRLVQELMENGLPSTQVVSVVQSMLTSSGSSSALPGATVPDTELHVADMEPPPEYDFKDRPTRGA
ncbi:hypothetical protein FS837_011324 [Tulasnella sp. UAMH 9824]|nr:hypothetical protein FS837_011324 [Tulasnella sp. UAMH 9824]